MLLVPTSQLVITIGPEIFGEKEKQKIKLNNLLFVAVEGVAAGVAGAVYPEE